MRTVSSALLGALLLALSPTHAVSAETPQRSLGLETVLPTYPGKNRVRWFEFDWKWTELRPAPDGAPVRLYFYERARNVARHALAFTGDAYREYVERFGFRPTETIPYILYNSHFEFESTNAFLISEGVLGVTSTTGLTMALPYWGEHRRFLHVMRHELAHQFTIQQVLALSKGAGCNPLPAYPLWFVEGLAEHVSQGSLGAEVRAVLADRLIVQRKDEEELPRFFGQGPFDFERIYLLGHAQVAFLEDVAGPGTVRRLLEAAPRFCGGDRRNGLPLTFEALVSEVTKLPLATIDDRWHDWAIERVAAQLGGRHPLGVLRRVRDLGDGEIDVFALAPDGHTIFYRTFDRDSGRSRLHLQDLAQAGSRRLVVEDQRPGLVSLHPRDRRVVALTGDRLAYIGRVDAVDVLFVRRYTRRERGGRTELVLGEEARQELWHRDGIIELGHPAFRPQDGALFFVGLDQTSGLLDVYRMDDPFRKEAPVVPVTRDPYAERDLAFDRDGSLLLASDATPDGSVQIFRLPLDAAGAAAGAAQALTSFGGGGETGGPTPDASGGVVFASDASGATQAYRRDAAGITRLSEVPTAFGAPVADARGDLLGIVYADGRRFLARLARARFLSVGAPEAVPAAPLVARPLPAVEIPGESGYTPLSTRNVRLANAFALASTGPFVLGTVVFTDILRDYVFGVQAQVIEEWERTNAEVFYVNRARRLGYGASAFVLTGLQVQPSAAVGGFDSYLLQRVGGSLTVEYPFGRFARVEASLSPQAVRAFDFTDPTSEVARDQQGFFAAVQVGARLAFDATRVVPPLGPTSGYALRLDANVTQGLGQREPFGNASGELRLLFPLFGTERLYLSTRLAAGGGFGGGLSEQFYLPAAYNLRAYSDDSLQVIARHFYLGTVELRFPLDRLLPVLSYVEGHAGVDAGATFFDLDQALDARVAAAVVGVDFGLGIIIPRLTFARPFDIGKGVPRDEWITHFSILTPFFFF